MTWPKDPDHLLFYTDAQKDEIAQDAGLERLDKYDVNEMYALWVMVGRLYQQKRLPDER